MKVKYINNNLINGVKYDWNFILKEYEKTINAIVPLDENRKLFDWKVNINKAIWNIELSERSIGKTTKWLLIGLIMHKHYGTRIEYIRSKSDMVRPSNAGKMWDTIKEYGYIDHITCGEYNTVIYNYKAYFLAHQNESGDIDKVDTEELCHLHAISNVDNEKSVYNSPKGDLIIYDEFIPTNGITDENTWIEFTQMLSTIIRLRISHKIVLLSNTVNIYTHIFHELDIATDIKCIKRGEHKIVTTKNNMQVYVAWLSLEKQHSSTKKERLMLTFNFSNPRLSSIYGSDSWEVKNYPHKPRFDDEKTKILKERIYIEYYNQYLQVKICNSNIIGNYLQIHTVQEIKTSKATCIFTIGELKNIKYYYGLQNKIGKIIFDMYNQHKIYYSHNDDGNVFECYLKESGYIRKL